MRRGGGADCGDPGGKLGRGRIAEGGVRSLAVVVADPFANRAAGMAEAEEQRLVEQLISHPAELKLSMNAFCIGFPGAM